jgi:multiple antibiotic resistance protein
MDFFLTTLFSLFSIVDPPGAIPVYLALTGDRSRPERNRIALLTSFYFLLILLAFFLAGTYILSFFGISIHALRIAGGMVLLNSGVKLMATNFTAPGDGTEEGAAATPARADIAFSPMAMPLLSGPGSISYLITQSTLHTLWSERLLIAAAILAVTVLVWISLRVAPFLFRVLGRGGLTAIARIMGFIVIAIGVQFIVNGLVQLVQTFLQ